MSIIYDSNDTPPSWHRAAASLSQFATALPFQLPLGFNIWATSPEKRDDVPDIVLVPPTPERPVITMNREENRRLTERFFTSQPTKGEGTPPRINPNHLLPLPPNRRKRTRRQEDRENKENAAPRPQQPRPARPLQPLPAPATSPMVTTNDPFSPPRLTRPPSALKPDPLPRRSNNPFRQAPPPPGLVPLMRRPIPSSPTPLRRRQAALATCQDQALEHASTGNAESSMQDETVEEIIRPRSPRASVYRQTPDGQHSRTQWSSDFTSANPPPLWHPSASQRPARQLTPSAVRPARGALADNSQGAYQMSSPVSRMPLPVPSTATRNAGWQAAAVHSTSNPTQSKKGSPRALRERTNTLDSAIPAARKTVKGRKGAGSVDLDRLKKIWDSWDWSEGAADLAKSAALARARISHPRPVSPVTAPAKQAKIVPSADWFNEEDDDLKGDPNFVIGDWEDDEDIWEDCSL